MGIRVLFLSFTLFVHAGVFLSGVGFFFVYCSFLGGFGVGHRTKHSKDDFTTELVALERLFLTKKIRCPCPSQCNLVQHS